MDRKEKNELVEKIMEYGHLKFDLGDIVFSKNDIEKFREVNEKCDKLFSEILNIIEDL